MVEQIGNIDKGLILFDGWYGVDWYNIITTLKNKLGNHIEFVNSTTLFKSQKTIEDYQSPFVTDDPSFGWVNDKGVIEDLMDENKIEKFKKEGLEKGKK